MKIAITTSSFARYSDEPLKLLEQAGVEYVMNDKGRALTEEEAIQMLEGCHGVAARWSQPYHGDCRESHSG